MFGQAAAQRTIPGAVATAGVNERVAFLRRTYAHLGAAILALIAVCYAFMNSELGARFTIWAFSGQFNWLLVLGLFMVIGHITQRLAQSDTSVGMQYVGLTLGVIAQGVILTPLLYVAANYAKDPHIIEKAGLVTLLIFAGLTATVFITRKDFSFLRGILMIATFAAFGLIILSILFGWHLGSLFAVAMIVLMAGWILYQTSLLMAYFRPTQHVSAALMLFSTIATLFWYVLMLFMNRE